MKKKILYLTYEELCKKFKEDPVPKGNRRQAQKHRFEKKGYSINWLDDLRQYEVIPLTKTELTKKLKNCNVSLKDFAEPIIISCLLENPRLVKTSKDLAYLFGLVNAKYNEVFKDNEKKTELSDTIDVSKTKIDKFQKTVDEMNWEAIKGILGKLQDNHLLEWHRCYSVREYVRDDAGDIRYSNGYPVTNDYETKDDEGKITTSKIMNKQNSLATELFGEENEKGEKKPRAFYSLTEEQQAEVIRRVCDYFDFYAYWYTNVITASEQGLKYELNKKINILNNKLQLNKQNHVKIANSTRGDFFKALEEKDKIKLINSLIDIKKDEIL